MPEAEPEIPPTPAEIDYDNRLDDVADHIEMFGVAEDCLTVWDTAAWGDPEIAGLLELIAERRCLIVFLTDQPEDKE
jgi:hypothetical protein